MNNRKLTSLLCGGVLSLTSASLIAQQSTTSDPSSRTQSPQSTQPALGQGSSSSTLRSGSMHSGSGSDVRLSQVMNSTVQSQEGKTLGQIRDLTVDPQSGRIEFAILSLSGAGAAGDTSTSARETAPSNRSSNIGTPGSTAATTTTGKLIPVPWQLFSQSGSSSGQSSSLTSGAMSGQKLVLNIDDSKLRTAPSFDANDWKQFQSGNLDQRVYAHFGVDRSSAIGTPGTSIRGQGASGTSDLNDPSIRSQTGRQPPSRPGTSGTSPQSTTPQSTTPDRD